MSMADNTWPQSRSHLLSALTRNALPRRLDLPTPLSPSYPHFSPHV